MSHLQTNLDFPDFDKLVEEGFSVRVEETVLIIDDIPYLDSALNLQYGTMITPLNIAGNKVQYPINASQHIMHFTGSDPYTETGVPIKLGNCRMNFSHDGITTSLRFSRKPPNDYKNYYHKVTGYASLISGPAILLHKVTPRKQTVCQSYEEENVFVYMDTNSERAAISMVTNKLKAFKIGIVGAGGTGSYILDAVAKTPVRSIDLFDADILYNHNAFRAPGAAPVETLQSNITKVDYLANVYSKMHKHIKGHAIDIDTNNVHMLGECNFVFISVDKGGVKKIIFDFLESNGIPYIDVGMGLELTPNDSLIGTLRTVAVTNESRKRYRANISQVDTMDEIYESNIQIAELNMLNAATAVILWKKHAGFYSESIPHGMITLAVDTLLQTRSDDEAKS